MVKKKSNNQKKRENQELLELAVSCRFISPSKEKEILSELLEYSKKITGNSVVRFLLKKNILPKEKIELLFAIKKHVDTLMADKKFGKIGVANELVSPQHVKKALDLQVAIFRKKKKSVKIGDILVNNNEMSVEDRTAVLLAQDRIKDELLADALNSLATSEMDRIALNKRFGAIAVKKELISTKQLNQALKIQKEETQLKGEKRYIGEILKDVFSISDKNIMNILKAQKKFEIKRLNLKEDLAQFNSEKESNQSLDNFFEYHVSEDKLSAVVKRIKKEEIPTQAEGFLNWFSLSGIVFGLCPLRAIDAFLEKNKPGDQLKIAQGHAPVFPEKASIEFFFNSAERPEIMPVVSQGDRLARVVPQTGGEEGVDVFGRPVCLPDDHFETLNCGEGVSQKDNEFIALIDGYPRLYKKRTLFVTSLTPEYTTQKIKGDITADLMEPLAMLKVEGNIAPGVKVSCHKLDIQGSILGHVTATGDIDVYGNIGQISGDADALLDPVIIFTKGMIRPSKNIMNARIVGEKGINGPKSDLISSHATSFCDIVVKNIFSSQDAPSILRFGREYVLKIEKIDQEIQKKTRELNDILHKDELDLLSNELMDQVQVQNGYLEKQNVTICLGRILSNPQWDNLTTVAKKREAYEAGEKGRSGDADTVDDEKDITIHKNTKAYKFMEIICEKIERLPHGDQKKYVQELHDNIAGMYKGAVRLTDRINRKLKARSQEINRELELDGLKPEIEEKENTIDALRAQKDLLQLNRDDESLRLYPAIKVKNKVAQYTIIKGEKAQLLVDKDMHGISLKEERNESQAEYAIKIEGYFD